MDNLISFCELKEGDLFEFNGQTFKVIPLEKTGACGCIPNFNAVDITDQNVKIILHCEYKVRKVENES